MPIGSKVAAWSLYATVLVICSPVIALTIAVVVVIIACLLSLAIAACACLVALALLAMGFITVWVLFVWARAMCKQARWIGLADAGLMAAKPLRAYRERSREKHEAEMLRLARAQADLDVQLAAMRAKRQGASNGL